MNAEIGPNELDKSTDSGLAGKIAKNPNSLDEKGSPALRENTHDCKQRRSIAGNLIALDRLVKDFFS
jgi:hypothetical protein